MKKLTPEELIKIVINSAQVPSGIDESIKEYDVSQHKVFDMIHRPKKQIAKPDPEGKLNDDGTPKIINTTEEVVRIGIPFQKIITKRRRAFMNIGSMVIQAKTDDKDKSSGEKLVKAVSRILDSNKWKFKLKDIAKRQMSEKQAALLFYTSDSRELIMRILSPALGDELLPVFDAFGKLILFGRGYTIKDDDGKEIKCMDIYQPDKVIHFQEGEYVKETPLKYGKIPIIYFSQDDSEWADVQWMIERLETLLSNFGDTNDYNGSPILVARGIIKGFSAKGERGKVLEIEGEDADVKYVNWDQAPASIKLEIETLIDLIHTMSQTPQFNLKELSGLGTSGVSFDRIFMDPQMAAQDKLEESFGEGLQRMVNFIKTAIGNVFDLSLKNAASAIEIEPIIMPFRISERQDDISDATAANGGKPIVSRLTSIKMAGLVDDPNAELKAILKEEDSLGVEVEEEI